MTFKINVVKPATTSGGTNEDRPKVDYDALNQHIVEQCKAATKPRSLPGYISGIIDLGIQAQQDYEGPKEAGKSYPETAVFFKGEDGKEMVRYPRKPTQQVAITVDFPQILIDYGQFYSGESAPVPYRMLLNGEFSQKNAEGKWDRVVGRGFSLQELPDNKKRWGIPKQSVLFKLADACELLDSDGLFQAERVGELLGRVAQFQISVVLKDGKYLNEKVTLAGVVPEGLPIPPLDGEYIYGVNFSGENDSAALKKLRKSIKTTISRALNFEGSDIQRQLAEIEAGRKAEWESSRAEKPKPATKPAPKPKAPPVEDEPFSDDDIPF